MCTLATTVPNAKSRTHRILCDKPAKVDRLEEQSRFRRRSTREGQCAGRNARKHSIGIAQTLSVYAITRCALATRWTNFCRSLALWVGQVIIRSVYGRKEGQTSMSAAREAEDAKLDRGLANLAAGICRLRERGGETRFLAEMEIELLILTERLSHKVSMHSGKFARRKTSTLDTARSSRCPPRANPTPNQMRALRQLAVGMLPDPSDRNPATSRTVLSLSRRGWVVARGDAFEISLAGHEAMEAAYARGA